MRLIRILRHLFTLPAITRRRFGSAAAAPIAAAIRAAEQRSGGEIRFAVETALDLRDLWHGLTPRQRAEQVFAQLQVWDTELRNGILIYVLMADRDVEIIADRGAATLISTSEWEAACRLMEDRFRAGRFTEGAAAGIDVVGDLLARHFPLSPADRDELPEPAGAAVAECRQTDMHMRCHNLKMKSSAALRPLIVPALLLVSLSGCSLLSDGPSWGAKREAAKAAAAAAAVPVLPDPVATHVFKIDATTDIVGVVQKTVATKEDTLTDIARRFNVGYEEIVRANPGVDPWLPGENREIVIPSQFILPNAPREGIVINAAAMRLFYYPKAKKNEQQVVHTYPIGIGKVGWKTPEGTTKIMRRTKDPVWRPTASILAEHKKNDDPLPNVVPAGPDNPLGRFAFYLGWPTYMIHGTNKPAGVGLRSSHGCIRLYPEDIAQLFELAPIGTQVRVVNQPFLFGWHDAALHIQAFDILEDDPRDWKKAQAKLLNKALAERIQQELAARKEKIDWEAVSKLSHDPRGIPVSISGGPDQLDHIVATATIVQNKVAPGATWDGISDLPVDEATFQELVSDREASVESAAAATTPAPAKSGTN